MDFRGDERAVTVQIGAVLLLGFLVVTLSLYQATVVPNQNSQVEFQHNQRVQADMQEVRNAILGTAATGSAAPVGVELGTRYPSRVVAVNPAPPSGSLSTTALGDISIQNAEADDSTTATVDYPETDDFWNGTPRNYTTASLVYRPNYANFQNAPTTVYENGVVYNHFRSGNLTLTGQSVVAGSRISLVVLSGDLSRSGSGTLTVDPRAVSVSTRTVSISNDSDGGDVSVVLPSRLGADTWEELLSESGEYDPSNASTDAHVYDVQNHAAGVELFFEPGVTYELKLSKVGVGTNVEGTEPAYLTSVDDLVEQPFEGRTYPFVVESRDRFNNPVGADVLAATDRPPEMQNGVTVEPGRYRYQYTAPPPGGDRVNVSYLRAVNGSEYDVESSDFNGSKQENVQYDLVVQSVTGGGGGSGGPLSLQAGSGEASANGGDSTGIQFVIANDGSDTVTIESITLSNPSNSATLVYEGGNQAGNGEREVFVDVGDDGSGTENPEDGSYETKDNNINSGKWEIGSTGDLTDKAEISGSQSARFYVFEFYESRNPNPVTVDMSGESITVTLTYSTGGTQYTEDFDVTASA
ncbi:MAG: hypothetical protein ABEI27_14075 [Halobellus sp.]|uniref:hypothetical protein n=1 Tax=Halobellus sp. TaxID=1979212 RepID=UPI0035D49739